MENSDTRETRRESERSVLIVEDDSVARRVFTHVFSRLGWTIQVAVSGAEALQLIQREAFDLVILDAYLPDMHGAEVAKAIRQEFKAATSIIAASSDDAEANVRRMKEAGVDGFLVKPVTVSMLEDLVSRTFHRPVPIDSKSRTARVKFWFSKPQ